MTMRIGFSRIIRLIFLTLCCASCMDSKCKKHCEEGIRMCFDEGRSAGLSTTILDGHCEEWTIRCKETCADSTSRKKWESRGYTLPLPCDEMNARDR